jgi:uncharacterized protein
MARPGPVQRLLTFLLLAGVLVPRCAGAEALTAVTLRLAQAPRTPLVWRVTKGNATSHLFGTVHVPMDLDAALGDSGRAALRDAKRVYVELDITSPPVVSETVQYAWHRAELPQGESLHALLKPQAWDRLILLSKDRVPRETLDRMEPWFASESVIPFLSKSHRMERTSPQEPRMILDAAVVARAKERGVPVVDLETPLEHLQAISRVPRPEAVKMLEELVLDPAKREREFGDLVGAYASADDRRLLKAFGRLWRRRPAVAENLLFRRNERWCERLDLWLGEGNIFVAAGAFHMFGNRGLVAMLRQRGYRVERVPPDEIAGAVLVPAVDSRPSTPSPRGNRRPSPRT